MTTDERALDTVARLAYGESAPGLLASLRESIAMGDSRKHDYAVILAALREQEAVTWEAAARLVCSHCRDGWKPRLVGFGLWGHAPDEGRGWSIPCDGAVFHERAEACRQVRLDFHGHVPGCAFDTDNGWQCGPACQAAALREGAEG